MASGTIDTVAKRSAWTVSLPRNTITYEDANYIIIGNSLVIARAIITPTESVDGNSYIVFIGSSLPTPKSMICGVWTSINDAGLLQSSPNSGTNNIWFIRDHSRIMLTNYHNNPIYIKLIYEI